MKHSIKGSQIPIFWQIKEIKILYKTGQRHTKDLLNTLMVRPVQLILTRSFFQWVACGAALINRPSSHKRCASVNKARIVASGKCSLPPVQLYFDSKAIKTHGKWSESQRWQLCPKTMSLQLSMSGQASKSHKLSTFLSFILQCLLITVVRPEEEATLILT